MVHGGPVAEWSPGAGLQTRRRGFESHPGLHTLLPGYKACEATTPEEGTITVTKKNETRRFKMHPKLLFDVIRRQAGSLSKAILEGVMNSDDAKASRCVVTLDQERLTIWDDGKGMSKRKEIEEFFEVFGTPHDETEQKKFGTFRMGRGQLFAYGVNSWRTGPFEMAVDIKNEGLEYRLTEHAAAVDGCTIEIDLYDRLLPSDLHGVIRTLKDWVKYSSVEVELNGEVVTVDPETEKWDHVTDDAYVRLTNTLGLSIYNLGIFVCQIQAHRFGTGGVLVSRKQLRMNFARNDIQSDCEVWKRLKPFLVEQSGRRVKKERLTDAQRQHMIDRFLEDPDRISQPDLWGAKLVKLTNGRMVPLSKLHAFGALSVTYGGVAAHAREGDVYGDRVHQRKLALVVSDETLEEFGYRPSDEGLSRFFEMQLKAGRSPARHRWRVRSMAELQRMLSGSGEIIPEKKWNVRTRVWVHLLKSVIPAQFSRRVLVGNREGVYAWTDGSTYVAFDHRFLKGREYTLYGIVEVLQVLVHELAHDDGTLNGHVHGVGFLETFEELSRAHLPLMVHAAPAGLVTAIETIGRRTTKELAKLKDKVDKLEIAAKEAEELEASWKEQVERKEALEGRTAAAKKGGAVEFRKSLFG